MIRGLFSELIDIINIYFAFRLLNFSGGTHLNIFKKLDSYF
jgi:hypothetical protein